MEPLDIDDTRQKLAADLLHLAKANADMLTVEKVLECDMAAIEDLLTEVYGFAGSVIFHLWMCLGVAEELLTMR